MPNSPALPGHVFVVQGRLEHVTCDAALIPTDTSFRVERPWWKVVGRQRRPVRPDGWTELGFGQDNANGLFWYVDVTNNDEATDGRRLIGRLSLLIASIATRLRRQTVARDRARHLVAMPLLGAAGGGLSAAESVRVLIDGLQSIADENGIDLAIVVLERDAFEALQRQRQCVVGPRSQHPEEARRLGRIAQRRGLSLMIGAGVSMGAGLPDWTGLLRELAKDVADRSIVESEVFGDLHVLDQAELLARLLRDRFNERVVGIVTGDEQTPRLPALGHLLLAGLRCSQVATTNYDLLYETALRSQADSKKSVALPYERPRPGEPWILKLHGDSEHKDDLVLNRTSFVGYDARRRAAGSVFQAMLMTSHVLFVGVSLTDDNVLRLTHEVTGLVPGQTLGTTVDLGVNVAKKELWKGTLEWIEMTSPRGCPATDSTSETSWQVRELEIFLDGVAMWSIGPDDGS